MLRKDIIRKAIKEHGIDWIINIRFRTEVLSYYASLRTCSKGEEDKANKMPSYLKYGGHRNTCYDY